MRNAALRRWAPFGALNPIRYGRDAASLRLFHEASSTIEEAKYDLVHCHFGPNGLRAVRLREIGALQGKIVTTFYGFDVSSYVASRGASVYAPLFAQGDLCIGITDRMRRRLIELGCPPDRALHLALGIDVAAFPYRPDLRRKDAPIRVLGVGRLVEKKGFETAIRAFALVARKHPEMRYTIVGDGDLRGRLQRLIRSLGLAEKVQLLGDMTDDEVRAQYAASDIFLLASQRASNGDEEGLPQVLLEAQAVGLPVVSTLHSGIGEGVLDGKSAFLVPEGNVEAVAERLEFLVEHPECWQAMGSAGRAFVEANYDVEASTDRLVRAYEQLLS